MNLLQVQNLSKSYGSRILFERAQVAINEGEHVGVIGPNGAGKTTFFKIIAGIEEADSGLVIKMQGLRLGYLEQESDWDIQQTVESYLANECVKPLWELKKLGLSLGLTEGHFQSEIKSLSGGYRMRVKLLYLIGCEPHLMLLDEPTNFLDLESILALEHFLQDYKGAFLLISHDREFLKRTTEYTVEVEAGEITKFPGHIEDYFEQKEELRNMQLAQAANQEAKRQHLQEFVDRFRAKATKARQAQSRMKQLEKMERIEIKALPTRSQITLPEPLATGKEVLTLIGAKLGYDTKVILSDVNLSLLRGKHLGVVGYNGVGKSTLLKSLAGRLDLISGERKLGHNVEVSYFAQHVAEELSMQDTILEALQSKAAPDTKAQEILNMAGSLLFSGEAIYKKISVLSGGEKARVALGQMLLQKKPVLILDEPTNHLDFETVEVLANALSEFQGTLVCVSHDRNFLKRVANQILEIRDAWVSLYPGSYEEYLWSLEKGMMKAEGGAVSATVSLKTLKDKDTNNLDEPPKLNYKEETKRLNGQIKELQRKIFKTEEALSEHQKDQARLNEQLMTAQGEEASQLARDLAKISSEVMKTEDGLLLDLENLEQLEKEFQKLTNHAR